MKDLNFTLRLDVYKDEFNSTKLDLLNSIRYEIVKPFRSDLGHTKIFASIIPRETELDPPANLFTLSVNDSFTSPPFVFSDGHYSGETYQINYSTSDEDKRRRRVLFGEGEQQGSTEIGTEEWERAKGAEMVSIVPVTNSKPSQSSEDAPSPPFFTPLPYLPFFSDCDYFGAYIFLPYIFEFHPRCKLIPLDDVVPIKDFRYGMEAVADSCLDISTTCRYSESVLSLSPSDKPWFMADKGEEIFWLYQSSVDGSTYQNDLNGKKEISEEDVNYFYTVCKSHR